MADPTKPVGAGVSANGDEPLPTIPPGPAPQGRGDDDGEVRQAAQQLGALLSGIPTVEGRRFVDTLKEISPWLGIPEEEVIHRWARVARWIAPLGFPYEHAMTGLRGLASGTLRVGADNGKEWSTAYQALGLLGFSEDFIDLLLGAEASRLFTIGYRYPSSGGTDPDVEAWKGADISLAKNEDGSRQILVDLGAGIGEKSVAISKANPDGLVIAVDGHGGNVFQQIVRAEAAGLSPDQFQVMVADMTYILPLKVRGIHTVASFGTPSMPKKPGIKKKGAQREELLYEHYRNILVYLMEGGTFILHIPRGFWYAGEHLSQLRRAAEEQKRHVIFETKRKGPWGTVYRISVHSQDCLHIPIREALAKLESVWGFRRSDALATLTNLAIKLSESDVARVASFLTDQTSLDLRFCLLVLLGAVGKKAIPHLPAILGQAEKKHPVLTFAALRTLDRIGDSMDAERRFLARTHLDSDDFPTRLLAASILMKDNADPDADLVRTVAHLLLRSLTRVAVFGAEKGEVTIEERRLFFDDPYEIRHRFFGTDDPPLRQVEKEFIPPAIAFLQNLPEKMKREIPENIWKGILDFAEGVLDKSYLDLKLESWGSGAALLLIAHGRIRKPLEIARRFLHQNALPPREKAHVYKLGLELAARIGPQAIPLVENVISGRFHDPVLPPWDPNFQLERDVEIERMRAARAVLEFLKQGSEETEPPEQPKKSVPPQHRPDPDRWGFRPENWTVARAMRGTGTRKSVSDPTTGFPPQRVPRGGNDKKPATPLGSQLIALANERGLEKSARVARRLTDKALASLSQRDRMERVLEKTGYGWAKNGLGPWGRKISASDLTLLGLAALARSDEEVARTLQKISDRPTTDVQATPFPIGFAPVPTAVQAPQVVNLIR